MIASAAILLRHHGSSSTSFPKVLTHSGAPRGSIGHHFPGGKTELLREAVTAAGSEITERLTAAAAAGADATTLVDGICDYFTAWLVRTDFTAGCPVAAVAQDAYDNPELAAATNRAIQAWTDVLSDTLTGDDPARARALAQLCVAAVEGAIMMARVAHSTEPLDAVRAQLRPLLTNP